MTSMADDSPTYGQYCPIARALDVLGERWSLLILRDMIVGTTRFNDLARGLPGLSRSLLTKRLRQLERAGLVERVGSDYLLTEAGRDLEPIVFGLGPGAPEWTFGDPDPASSTPSCSSGGCTPGSTRRSLPGRGTCFHIRFTDDPRAVLDRHRERRCRRCACPIPASRSTSRSPSDVDVALPGVARPRIPLQDATRSGGTSAFDGPGALIRRMPEVFQLSPVADIVSAAG